MIVTRVHGPGDYRIERGWPQEDYMGSNMRICEENGPLHIGARYINGHPDSFFYGKMDDLQIYTEVAR